MIVQSPPLASETTAALATQWEPSHQQQDALDGGSAQPCPQAGQSWTGQLPPGAAKPWLLGSKALDVFCETCSPLGQGDPLQERVQEGQ